VFDRYPEIGGLLTFGISPSSKLGKAGDVTAVGKSLKDGHRVFRLNTEIGKDSAIDELMAEYDAVFMGMGYLHLYERAGFPGEGSAACMMNRAGIIWLPTSIATRGPLKSRLPTSSTWR